jgi:hypothetical protein
MKSKTFFTRLSAMTKWSLALSLFMATNSNAQVQNREIGVRFSNLSSFDLVYKTQKAENKFRRYRLGAANIGLSTLGGSTQGQFNAQFAIGTEKRKNIAPNLQFIHGFEPAFSLMAYSLNSNATFMLGLGLGYVLGVQYDLSPKMYINLEAIPSINASMGIIGGSTLASISSGFSSSGLAFSVVYKFSTEAAKKEETK